MPHPALPPLPDDAERALAASSRRVRVAAVQMVSTPRVAENLAVAEKWIAKAAAQGAQIIALPEYFSILGGRDDDKLRVREADGVGPMQDFLAETARRQRIWLVGGSIPLVASTPDKVLNSCLVFDPKGERVARYDKIHLFDFQNGTEHYRESASIEAGTRPVAFDTPFGRIGLSICYDLRFPELYRALGTLDLLVVPAAFTAATGRAHWEVLLRARAIENQCYVLAAAQGGTHENGRQTHGHSVLIDPWGEIIGQLPKGPGFASGAFDLARIAEIRSRLPAQSHRVLNVSPTGAKPDSFRKNI